MMAISIGGIATGRFSAIAICAKCSMHLACRNYFIFIENRRKKSCFLAHKRAHTLAKKTHHSADNWAASQDCVEAAAVPVMAPSFAETTFQLSIKRSVHFARQDSSAKLNFVCDLPKMHLLAHSLSIDCNFR